MSSLGPGDKPRVVRRRAARVQRQERTQQARTQQAAYGSQGRAVRNVARQRQAQARTQRAAQNARPLSPKPVRPKQVVRPLAQRPPRRVTVAQPPEGPRDVRQVQRQAAVHMYDQMSGRQKQARVRQAQRNIKTGKADESDRAVAHIHATRVAGSRKVAAAVKAFNEVGAPKRGLRLDPAIAATRTPHKFEANVGGVANLPSLGKVASAITTLGAASSKGYASVGAPKVLQNAPKDIAEIAVTTPSSIAKLGSDIVHHPRRVPGELAAPVVETVKHPIKSFTERPVSTVLMFAPAARLPGRLAGRVARVAGKQTLVRPAATLPHTTLKEARTGSRGAVTRKVQTKRDVRRGAPKMTQAQVQRRVDEFYDFSKQHVQRVVASASKEAKHRGMSKEKAAEHVSGARGGARDHQVRRMFAKEFGARVRVERTPAKASTRVLYHGSPHGPDKVMKEGLRVGVSPDAPNAATARRGVFLSSKPRTARVYGRHIYEVDAKAVRDLSRDPSGPGAVHTPHAIPASALRYRGRAGDYDERLVAQLEREGLSHRDAVAETVRLKDDPTATQGVLHNSRETADAVTAYLNNRAEMIKRGAHGPHQAARRNADVPLEFQTVDAGYGQFASVPKTAAERLMKHQVVGSSKAPGAQYMRVAGRSFRGAVLPLSARWLFGQVGEAGFRAGVAGAGPADLVRFNRVVKEMNKVRPGSGDEFVARVHGGQFDLTGTAREFANGKTLAEELKGTAVEDLAHGATRLAQAAPLKKVRAGWNQYSRVVFDVINGQIETTARKAMAGQAIRQGPLMQGRLLGLTDRAIQEAARGLRGTDSQVAAARAVDRMYGQYQKFSPEKREHLLHTTPFYPWYRNTVTFLTQTLPVDHPLKAALVADLDAATEDWRKAHGLSLRQGGGKPGFLLGTYPVGSKGQTVPSGRYLPFVPGQPLQAVGDLFLPQYANVQDILRGKDWKGSDVKARQVPGELAKSVIEAHVPGAGQAGRITGLSARYLEGKKDEPTVLSGKKLVPALVREVSPLPKTKVKPKRKRTVKRKSTGGGNPLLKSSTGGGNPLLKGR